MSLRPSFRLTLPIAALALLVALAAWPGAGPRAAEATVNSISPDTLIQSDGQDITITVRGTADSGDMDLNNSSDEIFTVTSCSSSGDCSGAVSVSPSATISLDTTNASIAAATYTLVVTMEMNCTDIESINLTAADDDNSRPLTVFCVPDDEDPQVVVRKLSDEGSFSYDFDWDANGGDCVVDAEGEFDLDDSGSFDLQSGDRAEFFCEDGVTLVVGEQDDADFVDVDCDDSDGVDDIDGDSVVFDISDIDSGDTVVCTWVNDEDLATTTPTGPVTSVQVVAAAQLTCGGTTAVQVTLRNASGGPAPAGTSVTATSSRGGSFQPASTLTGSFPYTFATFLYQAPANTTGLTTITVTTNNGVSGSANIQLTCATTAPVPSATSGPLRPPSAGDGGLLGGGGGGDGGTGFGAYLPSAFAAAVAALVIGGTLFSRRFAAVPAFVSAAAAPVSRQDKAASSSNGFALLASLALIGLALLFKRRAS